MSRKRRIFDINMPPADDAPAAKVPERVPEKRRGPMAAAITENADALRDRQSTENAIRAENDKLAHEFVNLRNQGLITDLVPLELVQSEKLTRDRAEGPDPDLEELKLSIREIGMSNPIRVELLEDGRYELIQGMRRLSAFKALLSETGDAQYAKIPAGIVSGGSTDDNYRRMVDENLIRKDISFAEMGALARAYAADPSNGCSDVDKAVAVLFKSASYTKRSYIRSFANLLAVLGDALMHSNAIPRNLGVDLKRKMDADPGLAARVSSALLAEPERDDAQELEILRSFVGEGGANKAKPVQSPLATSATRKAKITFQVSGAKGVAKCSASNGRLDLRYDVDFTRVDRQRLESAIARFVTAVQEE